MKNLSELTNSELIKIYEYEFQDYEKSFLKEVNDEIEKRNISLEEKRNIIISLNQVENKFDSVGKNDIKNEVDQEEFHVSKYTKAYWYLLQSTLLILIFRKLYVIGKALINIERTPLFFLFQSFVILVIFIIMAILLLNRQKSGWKLSVIIAFLMNLFSLVYIVLIVINFGYEGISVHLLLQVLQMIPPIVFLVLLLNKNTVRFFKISSKEFKNFILISLTVMLVMGLSIYKAYLLDSGAVF